MYRRHFKYWGGEGGCERGGVCAAGAEVKRNRDEGHVEFCVEGSADLHRRKRRVLRQNGQGKVLRRKNSGGGGECEG